MSTSKGVCNVADFDSLWDYNHPQETEHKFRAQLSETRNSGDAGYYAELLTQIARTQSLQRAFAQAHATLDEVEQMLTDDMAVARIRYLLERGRTFNSADESDSAIPLFMEAWALGKTSGEQDYAVDAAHMLGIAERTPETRMSWNLQALDLAQRSTKARRWLGSLYNNIGWAYVESNDLERALALFERALEFRISQGNSDTIFFARWCVAKVLRLLGRTEEALAIQTVLVQDQADSPEPDGFVFEELAECLFVLQREEEARPYFKMAYDMLAHDAWFGQNHPDRLERLKQLAGL